MIVPFKKTFVGADGRRYIRNPKLVFPEHIKNRRTRDFPKLNDKLLEVYMRTYDAARMMGCSASAARQYLHRHKVNYCVCIAKGVGKCNLWLRTDVARVLKRREPGCKRKPPAYMEMKDAQSFLGVARSYIYKLTRKGLVRQYKCRMKTPKGERVRCLYHRADLEHVQHHLRRKDGYVMRNKAY